MEFNENCMINLFIGKGQCKSEDCQFEHDEENFRNNARYRMATINARKLSELLLITMKTEVTK